MPKILLVLLAWSCALAQVSVSPDLGRPVPANLLRFYLTFPAPMARGRVLQQLRLLRGDGSAVPMPFLDMELWDREQRQLTVLIDPGRVKRGVAPQKEFGEVLAAGQRYTLVLDRDAEDAKGQRLEHEIRWELTAGPALRTGIDPERWAIASSVNSVAVDFDRSMDAAILDWALELYDFAGRAVEGDIRIERDAQRWVFQPTKPLPAGRYELRVDPAMEDVAGNRLGRPFDVEVAARPAQGVVTSRWFEIPGK